MGNATLPFSRDDFTWEHMGNGLRPGDRKDRGGQPTTG